MGVEVGLHLAGENGRHRDAGSRQLVPKRLRKPPVGRLRGPVYRSGRKGSNARARRHDHDVSAGAVQKVWKRGPDGVDRAEHVDADHLFRPLDLGVRERAVVRHAGVGDHQVEALGSLREPIDRASDLRSLGDIGDQRHMRSTVAFRERRGQFLETLPTASHQAQSGAPRGQRLAQRAADPARGAGDECPRAGLDPHGGILSLRAHAGTNPSNPVSG